MGCLAVTNPYNFARKAPRLSLRAVTPWPDDEVISYYPIVAEDGLASPESKFGVATTGFQTLYKIGMN